MLTNWVLKVFENSEKKEYINKEFDKVQEDYNMLATKLEKRDKKNIAKGRAQGRALERNKTRIETAQRMLEEGLDIKLISRITGLTKEKIEKLK